MEKIEEKIKPYIINFPKIGKSDLGYISIAEKNELVFQPKRIYWTYYTPESVERGGHAHKELEQVLIAVAGRIELCIETCNGETFRFILEDPSKGIFIPKKCWRTMKYSHNAVQVCMASCEYDESDYIRNYDDFKRLK